MTTPLPAQADLSIAELARILDVAAEVRRDRDRLEVAFRRNESREALRERLRAIGSQTGAALGDEQLDAAITWYYDNLHRYRRPKPSLSLFVAHLYVRRWLVLGIVLPLILSGGVLWWMLR